MLRNLFEKSIPQSEAGPLTGISLAALGIGIALGAFGVSRRCPAIPFYLVAGLSFLSGILCLI